MRSGWRCWGLAALSVAVLVLGGACSSASAPASTTPRTDPTVTTTVDTSTTTVASAAPSGSTSSTAAAGAPQPAAATVPSSTTTAGGVTTAPPSTRLATLDPPGSVAVISITDGDTFRAMVYGRSEPVRLIGINAPEGGECLADEATAFLASLIEAQTVTLTVDVSDRDRFDRLLRHVWVGEVLVGEAVVRAGYAVARRYEPDTSLAAVLEAAQIEAQAAQTGMWAPGACGTTISVDIAIDAYVYDAPGNDNQNLNGEWVRLRNTGPTPLVMTGWALKDESASHRFVFPTGFTLPAHERVTVYSGCGSNTLIDLYWCNTGSAVWNNSGDTIFMLDPNGTIVAFETY